MVVSHLGNRSIDRLAPVDLAVRIESAVRLFLPSDQVLASSQHDLLVVDGILRVLTGIEEVKGTVVLDNTASPAGHIRPDRVGAGGQCRGQLPPMQEVGADGVLPFSIMEIKDVVLAFPKKCNRIAGRTCFRSHVKWRHAMN